MGEFAVPFEIPDDEPFIPIASEQEAPDIPDDLRHELIKVEDMAQELPGLRDIVISGFSEEDQWQLVDHGLAEFLPQDDGYKIRFTEYGKELLQKWWVDTPLWVLEGIRRNADPDFYDRLERRDNKREK